MLDTLLGAELGALPPRYRQGFSEVRDIFALLTDLEKTREPPSVIVNEMLKLSGYMDMLTDDDSEEAAGRIENINELVNALTVWTDEHAGGGWPSSSKR